MKKETCITCIYTGKIVYLNRLVSLYEKINDFTRITMSFKIVFPSINRLKINDLQLFWKIMYLSSEKLRFRKRNNRY